MRQMTESDQKQLEDMNMAVKEAIRLRREWLDRKMEEYADVKVGEVLYELGSGQPVGVVSRLYRYWQDRDEGVRDTHLDVNYEYNTGGNCFDNTSRQDGSDFGRFDQVWPRRVLSPDAYLKAMTWWDEYWRRATELKQDKE